MDTTLLLLLVLVALPSCQSQNSTNSTTEESTIELEMGELEKTTQGNITIETIKWCLNQQCSQSGVCRSSCLEAEFVTPNVDTACPNLCKCCEPCKLGPCQGRCVQWSSLCSGTEYVKGTCDGFECFCCLRCVTDDKCRKRGGQCVNKKSECPCDYKETTEGGCEGECKCCVPCAIKPACAGQPDTGICVPGKVFCTQNEYISNEKCCDDCDKCLYCKKCQPKKSCTDEDGICLAEGNGCGPEMVKSETAECESCQCICCVTNPCPTSCDCETLPNPGECKKGKPTDCDEYISDDKCIGTGCSCHRKCIPDDKCKEMNGKCFNAKAGCLYGYTPTREATCIDSKYCVCCVPRISVISIAKIV